VLVGRIVLFLILYIQGYRVLLAAGGHLIILGHSLPFSCVGEIARKPIGVLQCLRIDRGEGCSRGTTTGKMS